MTYQIAHDNLTLADNARRALRGGRLSGIAASLCLLDTAGGRGGSGAIAGRSAARGAATVVGATLS